MQVVCLAYRHTENIALRTGVCKIIAQQATVKTVCLSALQVTACSKRSKKAHSGHCTVLKRSLDEQL
jgi:hypothetical protein